MTEQVPPHLHERALAAAVETTLAEVNTTPSRAPMVLNWVRGIATALMIGGSLVAPVKTPLRIWIFGGIFFAAMSGASAATKRRAGRHGARWIAGFVAAVMLVGLIATTSGLLSFPWVLGALGPGALLGWWSAHMQVVGESLTWTPGSDDLRYRDAGGTLDEAGGVAMIVSPIESDGEAIAAAAECVAQLGELRDVLAWLAFETGTSGRIAVDDLSDHQRRVLALAVRAHAATHGPTLPTPPAPSPPTLPA